MATKIAVEPECLTDPELRSYRKAQLNQGRAVTKLSMAKADVAIAEAEVEEANVIMNEFYAQVEEAHEIVVTRDEVNTSTGIITRRTAQEAQAKADQAKAD